MKTRPIRQAVAMLLLSVCMLPTHAAQNARAADAVSTPKPAASKQSGDVIYGSQLMSPEEKVTYRQRMRDARSYEEREYIRAEHHKEMQMRAKERGLTLPDTPPSYRGPGMGPGNGTRMGPGAGRGRASDLAPPSE